MGQAMIKECQFFRQYGFILLMILASFEDFIKGILEPSKLADFLFDELPKAQVEWTIVDGETILIYTKSKVKARIYGE
ncbi:hypothetical protein KFZ58_06100 [Virgibacillus sp. NKC19-16]|uniref:hypothetical protein n=1 Tax=Virgibacillus salidurans TaxID=2831673 RepID=UPI001F478A0E|nr:hypothetical protein [Virgibacillus sp. NKC19-16]UJL47452.1 hypothetical protein KFZ58_06100 [Virgibacillus sp. NKC19-16]